MPTCYKCKHKRPRQEGMDTHAIGHGHVFVCWGCVRDGIRTQRLVSVELAKPNRRAIAIIAAAGIVIAGILVAAVWGVV